MTAEIVAQKIALNTELVIVGLASVIQNGKDPPIVPVKHRLDFVLTETERTIALQDSVNVIQAGQDR